MRNNNIVADQNVIELFEAIVLPAPQGEGLGVGSVIKIGICLVLKLNTDPTPCPSPTMGGELLCPIKVKCYIIPIREGGPRRVGQAACSD